MGNFRKNFYCGDKNPNKSHVFNTSLLNNIDTEEKAYLLGWITSDGSIRKNSIMISIHKKDVSLLENLSQYIFGKNNVKKHKNRKMVSITINSKEMQEDVCRHLNIQPGKKAFTVKYPNLPEELHRHFIRGVFDGDGFVSSTGSKVTEPRCGISSGSRYMAESILKNAKRGCNIYYNKNKLGNDEIKLEWNGNNALDFLGWLYNNSSISLSRKSDLYYDWSIWVPSLKCTNGYGRLPTMKWNKADPNAIPPFKLNASDVGYDLTLIKKVKDIDDYTALYDTGLKISFDYGWYGQLVQRSSTGKLPYFMSNFVGIIDRNYRGSIMVLLRKYTKDTPDPILPLRAVQIIPTLIQNFSIEEVDEFELASNRSSNGFGSTGI